MLRALNCVEWWSCLSLWCTWYVFNHLDQFWSILWPNLTFYSQHTDFLFKIHVQGFKLREKVVLFVSLEHLFIFLAIWINFGWFFGQNWPNLTCSRPVYVLFMQNSNSWLETVWKSGLVWLSRPLDTVLAIWSNIWPILWSKWAKFDLYRPVYRLFMQNSNSRLETVWKSGFVWLSRTLDSVLAIWSYIWPILVQNGQIWPSMVYI